MYSRNPLRAATAIAFLVTRLALAGPVDAQTISSPAGDLRLGMTEGEAMQLFKSSVEEQKISDGTVVNRSLFTNFGHQSFGANLTSKGMVFSIVASEWYPGNSAGEQAAEQLYHHYLQVYGAPNLTPATQQGKALSEDWTNIEGHRVRVAITDCGWFGLSLQISDYQRELKDDGVSHDDRGRQSFGSSGISNCF